MRYAWLGILFLLIGCGPSPHYQQLEKVDNLSWSTSEVLDFSTTIDDADATYELQLIIDHEKTYRYENIYFKIITQFPNQEDKEEQLSVNIADNKGAWIGNCSNDNCMCKVFLLDDFKFSETGKYAFKISQHTRDENLQGINSLEMRLYKKAS